MLNQNSYAQHLRVLRGLPVRVHGAWVELQCRKGGVRKAFRSILECCLHGILEHLTGTQTLGEPKAPVGLAAIHIHHQQALAQVVLAPLDEVQGGIYLALEVLTVTRIPGVEHDDTYVISSVGAAKAVPVLAKELGLWEQLGAGLGVLCTVIHAHELGLSYAPGAEELVEGDGILSYELQPLVAQLVIVVH